jgi:hypothetical protein
VLAIVAAPGTALIRVGHPPPVPVGKTVAMGELVVRLDDDAYVLWSDTVDAPVSPVMPRTDLVGLLEAEYPMTWEGADALVEAANLSGTSDPARSLSDVLAGNRAGPGESRLTIEQLINSYRA